MFPLMGIAACWCKPRAEPSNSVVETSERFIGIDDVSHLLSTFCDSLVGAHTKCLGRFDLGRRLTLGDVLHSAYNDPLATVPDRNALACQAMHGTHTCTLVAD